MEDAKPFGDDTRADSGAISNPGALPLLPPLLAAQSPLNLSGSHSGPAPLPMHSPLDLSRNPSLSEPCGQPLSAASLMYQATGLVQQSSSTSQQQLQSMAQVRLAVPCFSDNTLVPVWLRPIHVPGALQRVYLSGPMPPPG